MRSGMRAMPYLKTGMAPAGNLPGGCTILVLWWRSGNDGLYKCFAPHPGDCPSCSLLVISLAALANLPFR